MIRRSRHHICMPLVSVVTLGRSRSTFAICTPVLRGAVTGLAERAPLLPCRIQAPCFISLSPSSRLGRGTRRKHPSASGAVPAVSPEIPSPHRGRGEASNSGYIKAKANLRLKHQMTIIHQHNAHKHTRRGYANAEFFQVFFFPHSN